MRTRLCLALLLAVGCKAKESDLCKQDAECPSGQGCNEGACLPRLTEQQSWAVEVVPRSESQWARSEGSSVTFSAEPVTLHVENETLVSGTIQPLDTDATMGVILSVPSAIGLPDRPFEAQSGAPKSGVSSFSVGLPGSAIGGLATARVTPTSPADRVLPPWSVTLTDLVAKGLVINVPKSDQLRTIEGVLQNAAGDQVITGYSARAVMGDRVVSSTDRTNDQGRFSLHLPMSVSLDQIKVNLDPTGETVMPSLVALIRPDKINLGMLRLPAAGKAQTIDVPVVGLDTNRKMPSVTLRFYSPLDGALGGTASVRRELQTDKDGIAHGLVLVGAAGEAVNYRVAAIPPTDADYGAVCVSALAISGTTTRTDPIRLPPRAEMAGSVQDATGQALRGVVITATRTDSAWSDDCDTDIGSLQATVTTAADGTFRLRLDPGTYRLQYEPGAGSASPLFVEDGVVVSGSASHGVSLPPGFLADGVVLTSDDVPASGCEVRLYRKPESGSLELRARARTGADGRFRIVVPQVP